MFYSQDLLCRRSGRFGSIWILATTSNSRCSKGRYISNKEISNIDIPRICVDIIHPPAPLSLRLTSTLLIGLAQALCRKTHLLYSDCHAMYSHVLAAPWVMNSQNLVDSHTSVNSAQSITLSALLMPEYAEEYGNGDYSTLQQLGWLPKDSGSSDMAASFTTSWESLSLAESDIRRGQQYGVRSARDEYFVLPPTPDSSGLLPRVDDAYSDDFVPLEPVPGQEDSEMSFRFDDGGDLHFDMDGEMSATNTHELLLPPPQMLGRGEHHVSSARAGRMDNEFFARLMAEEEKEEEGSNGQVAANTGSQRPKRQRLTKNTFLELDSQGRRGGPHKRHVVDLWGSTCYWDQPAQTRPAPVDYFARVANLCCMPHIPAISQLFRVPDWPASSNDIDQAGLSQDGDDGGYMLDGGGGYGIDDDYELEVGRGGGNEALAEEDVDLLNEQEYLNFQMDIPWLNPDLTAAAAAARPSLGHAGSIRAESSPDPAHHRKGSLSSQGTPGSRAPSSDLPSSDHDGLDIQSFQLAAGELSQDGYNRGLDNDRSLDSFLDISRLNDGLDQQTVEDMDAESQSFRRFALARMSEQDGHSIVFNNLLLPEYRTRRVAARAFSDLLQMATKSVFRVHQDEPFSTINISIQ